MVFSLFNPIALRKVKIVHNFGLSECSRLKISTDLLQANITKKCGGDNICYPNLAVTAVP